jgi:O-antigen/teichoic acid export membrane protein
VTVANIIASALNAVLWLIFAGILLPSQYGLVNFSIAIAAIGAVIGAFGINTLSITNIAKNQAILAGIYTLAFIISVVTSIALVLLTGSILVGILSFSLVSFSISSSFPLGKSRYKDYMKMLVGQRALLILLCLILYFTFGLEGILAGYSASLLLYSYKYFVLLIGSRFTFTGVTKRDISFAFHSFFMNFAQSSNLFIDKIIIAPLFGFYLLGLYQISTQFLMVLAIIPSSLFLYLLPKDSVGRSNRRIGIYALAFSALFSVILFFTCDFILLAFFPKYIEASPIIKVVAFGAIPMTSIATSNSKLLGMEKSLNVFIGSVIFLIILFIFLLSFREIIDESTIGFALVTALSTQAIFLLLSIKHFSSVHVNK